MESTILGLILDSSVLIAAERSKRNAVEVVETIQSSVGQVPIALSVVTIAEVAHGIYRATDFMTRDRRREFLDELKATIPVYAMTEDIAERVARVGAESASRGIRVALADLIIGATALGLGYAVATGNARDFRRIPELQVVEI